VYDNDNKVNEYLSDKSLESNGDKAKITLLFIQALKDILSV